MESCAATQKQDGEDENTETVNVNSSIDAAYGAESERSGSHRFAAEANASGTESHSGEGSVTDFSFMCLKGTKSDDDKTTEETHPSVSRTSDTYDTSHKRRGYAIVISQESFNSNLVEQGFGRRTGTGVDEQNIHRTLRALEFDVTTYSDLSANMIRRCCLDMAERDHSEFDCFVCVILSHGEEGVVYGKDKPVEIKQLVSYFKGDKCPSLVGKPKLFFIQACRGYQTDPGVGVNVVDALPSDEADAPLIKPQSIKIPIEADFLFAYSTVPGYFSWRNGLNGSWFIQALCDALQNHGSEMELLKLLTLVNKKVAQEFRSNNPDDRDQHKMKQIPCIASMLTKDVFFPRKRKMKIF